MTSSQIRQQFIDFFVSHGHVHFPESSLVPEDDPSVLLTTAGMQQFKPYFSHPDQAPAKRITTVQPSFRTTDIEEVGDESHNTFFEMLGNFSFGFSQNRQSISDLKQTPYFKEEAIKLAWKLMVDVYKIDQDRMYVTVFKGDSETPRDDETDSIWRSIGLPREKIKFGNRKDNFWGPTGDEGPCGPTAEIYVDDVEVWNNVFNEYYQHPDGFLEKLVYQGVDTGMGLERLVKVLQNKRHIFETDLFAPLTEKIKTSAPDTTDRSTRIIADHIRGVVFLIADNVEPSNVKQGYILRRLIRRASTHGKLIGAPNDLFATLVDVVIESLGGWYKKLLPAQSKIQKILKDEQMNFFVTLRRAHKQLEKSKAQAKDKVLSGQAVFDLQATFGLPAEITQALVAKEGLTINRQEFEQAMKQHQQVSRR